MKDLDYLKSVVRECKQMANDVCIKTGVIAEIKINSRAKKRWGLCTKLPNNTFLIEISSRLLEDDVEKDALMNTVMHEVLHTVKDCLNHGAKWKQCAQLINDVYGLNVKRCTSAEEKNIVSPVEESYNYIVACPKCGYQWKYIRKTKCVMHPSRYNHTGCTKEGLIRIL